MTFTRIHAALLFVLVALCAPTAQTLAGPADEAQTLEQILTKARASSGFSAGETRSGQRLTGEASLLGAAGKFVGVYARDGRFATSVTGELERAVSFDGSNAWEKEFSAGPYRLEFFAREWAFLRAWVHSGYWLDPEAPIQIRQVEGSQPGMTVTLQLDDGILVGVLELDPKTHLPRRLEIPNGSHELSVEYSAYAETDGFRIARAVHTVLSEGREVHWKVTAVVEVADQGASAFEPPRRTLDTSFDSTVNPTVEVVRSRRKHLYLRPKINGRDIGLFVFDTGAGFTGINRTAAKELGLQTIGRSSVTGLGGGVSNVAIARLDTFQLGPITIRDLVVSETGGSLFPTVKGEQVVGVIGWDLLIRAVVDFEPGFGHLDIFDPATYESDQTEWTPINLHYQVPYVSVAFEGDREGLFMVDTGSGSTLYFLSDVVRRMNLIKPGEVGPPTEGRGAGGVVTRTIGPMEWMQIAGEERLDDFTAVFGLGDDGETDPYSLGILGGGILRLYDLVIDYSRNRIAFTDSPNW